jgi:cell division protein FtsQ
VNNSRINFRIERSETEEAGMGGPARRWRLVRANALAIPSSVRRFNQRQRARRIRSARPWLIAAAGLALIGTGTFIVYGTSLFGVSHIRVVGSGFVGTPAVRTAAAVPNGTPLASVDLGAVEARVERLVGVRTARVRRDWPSTLTIDVTPRSAVAAVPVGKAYRLLDPSGVAFQTVFGRPELPLLQVATPGPDDPSTTSALTVLASLPAQIRDQLVRMTATSPAAVTLFLDNKREVIWGDASDNAAKARVAVSLLDRPGTVIDVSAPNVVTVR